MNTLLKVLTALRMLLVRVFQWNPLMRMTEDPKSAQTRVLLEILRRNRATVFGRQHGFADITSSDEYTSQVPVHTYEQLRELIEKQARENIPYLNAEQPGFYVLTSGTTAQPKYIPVLSHSIAAFRRSQRLVAFAVYRSIPEAFDGKVLAIVSPAIEGKLPSGEPYGSMSGLIYSSMPRLLQTKYVVPPDVFDIPDYNSKYFEIALHALVERNITIIATANPTTLLKLERTIAENCSDLLAKIAQRDPARAAELTQLQLEYGALKFRDLWPALRVVTMWTGGSCGVQIPAIKAMLPAAAHIVEVGYLSSEFRGGIVVDALLNREIPTLHENFFEFVRRNEWEDRNPEGRNTEDEHPQFLLLDQIEVGEQYHIFVTTQNGLYRYHINDVIEVTGHFNNTPTIRFVQKGKGVTTLTGEKLYESQLLAAIARFNSTAGTNILFFLMLGNATDLQYTLYLEHEFIDASALEEFLCEENIEFAAKRHSGRLNPLRIVFLRHGTGEAYKRYHVQRGQRENQFKLVHLQYSAECSFDFSPHVLGGVHAAD